MSGYVSYRLCQVLQIVGLRFDEITDAARNHAICFCRVSVRMVVATAAAGIIVSNVNRWSLFFTIDRWSPVSGEAFGGAETDIRSSKSQTNRRASVCHGIVRDFSNQISFA